MRRFGSKDWLWRFFFLEFTPALYDTIRGHEDLDSGEESQNLVMAHGRQTHRSDAAALITIRNSPKLTGRYLRGEIRRDCFRGPGEDAFAGIFWRRSDLLDQGVRHVQYGILHTQSFQLCDSRGSLRGRKYLRIVSTDLRCEEAESDLCDLRAAAPGVEELIEAAAAGFDFRRNAAMHPYLF